MSGRVLPATLSSTPPGNNRILAAIPEEVLSRLSREFQSVQLPAGAVLYEAGSPAENCYFVDSGLCSLVGSTANANSVEVGMIGSEGLVGLPGVIKDGRINYRAVVQLSASAFRVSARSLRAEMHRDRKLLTLLFAYMQYVNVQICQSAICNRFHSLEERLCRWLLICRDRTCSDELHLTQEFLSHMLGSTRSALTLTMGELQKCGAVENSRGYIQVINPDEMMKLTCECYQISRIESERFLALCKTD
jgi:CRP-like cAMP-binding protein